MSNENLTETKPVEQATTETTTQQATLAKWKAKTQ